MIGPHFNYLTDSYVKALGLERFPYMRPRPVTVVFQTPERPVAVDYRAFDWAVIYNHGLYLREPDGLAWGRK